MRIGLVGTDSSHAEQFLSLLKRSRHYPPHHQAVAICGEDEERTRELAREFSVPLTVANPADMLGQVDAAIIGARHGGRHLRDAAPFLRAGLPVFIDKPLAVDLADARTLVEMARQHGALLTSASALRWQPRMGELAAQARQLGGMTSLLVTGTFYPDSAYGGPIFYGIHAAEMALELAGHAMEVLSVTQVNRDLMRVNCLAGTIATTIELVTPQQDADSWFGVEMICQGARIGGQIELPEDYMAPVLGRFLTMIETGRQPLSAEQLLAPVELMTEIARHLR